MSHPIILARPLFPPTFRLLVGLTLGLAGTAQAQPANDNFANAVVLPGYGGYNNTVSTGATRETGEPSIVPGRGARSLWWRWTAPAGGPVRIEAWAGYVESRSFGPIVGVYTGSTLNNLVPVETELGLVYDHPTTLIFDATAGTTYYISLDPENLGSQIGLQYYYDYPEGVFIPGRYTGLNPDVGAALAGEHSSATWAHYYNIGVFENRVFDNYFQPAEYIELNPDVKAAFGMDYQAAMLHWITYGRLEGRVGRVPFGFNVQGYLANNPDVAAAYGAVTPVAARNVAVWYHYMDYGVYEGRTDGDFQAQQYLATNPDLVAAFGNDPRRAALHWWYYGRNEGRRVPAGFNVSSYSSRYADMWGMYGDDRYAMWLHFRDWGVNEGRNYDELFRADEYLALYPDLQAAFGTDRRAALMHWLNYGQAEGRQGRF